MMLYRFARKEYGTGLTGEGSRLHGGRWNNKGIPAVYASITISLALLELLIHSSSYDEMNSNMLMKIEIPESLNDPYPVSQLKKNWQYDTAYSQFIGTQFFVSKSSLLMKVPSAIIPEENNMLINPLHPDIKKVKIISAAPFRFDSRLFK